MQAFLTSTGIVTLAEIGDKTQILSLILAARYRKPIPIILGVFVATIVNHGLAGAVGAWLSSFVTPGVLRWVLAASFVLMAGWMLIPDKLDDADLRNDARLGVFGTTLLTFFIAEMGDKTQIVTVALAARFHDFLWVVAGSTFGMMIANVPAILAGHKFADRLPTKLVHAVAAVLFVVMGVAAFFSVS